MQNQYDFALMLDYHPPKADVLETFPKSPVLKGLECTPAGAGFWGLFPKVQLDDHLLLMPHPQAGIRKDIEARILHIQAERHIL